MFEVFYYAKDLYYHLTAFPKNPVVFDLDVESLVFVVYSTSQSHMTMLIHTTWTWKITPSEIRSLHRQRHPWRRAWYTDHLRYRSRMSGCIFPIGHQMLRSPQTGHLLIKANHLSWPTPIHHGHLLRLKCITLKQFHQSQRRIPIQPKIVLNQQFFLFPTQIHITTTRTWNHYPWKNWRLSQPSEQQLWSHRSLQVCIFFVTQTDLQ